MQALGKSRRELLLMYNDAGRDDGAENSKKKKSPLNSELLLWPKRQITKKKI